MNYLLAILAFGGFILGGCGENSKGSGVTKEELGEKLFFDKSISLTRNTSCATCHDPDYGFVDARFRKEGVDQSIFVNGAFSVGDDGVSLGGRNAPTAAYAQLAPEFHYDETRSAYVGGQFHDGRAKSLSDQAGRPPLDGAEMMMSDKNMVIERIKESEEYLNDFRALYGEEIFDDVNASYEAMRQAIGKFEKTELFAPFDSKYDKYRECKDTGGFTSECLEDGNWSVDEQLGFDLFFSEGNTNCASCHTMNDVRNDLSYESFSNFEYENIGSPRNIEAMNARSALGLQEENAMFLGLGGTLNAPEHYGKVKVPTLRNVAITAPYMSDGIFGKLRTVLEFYDHMAGNGDHPINPETGEPWGENDYNETINLEKLHDTAPLSDRKIRALEAFLRTLTDSRYESLLPELAPEGELGN